VEIVRVSAALAVRLSSRDGLCRRLVKAKVYVIVDSRAACCHGRRLFCVGEALALLAERHLI